VRYVVAGRERRFTIGDTCEWRATATRTTANDIRARARFGEDPLAELKQARTEPTVSDLCDRLIEEALDRKRHSTQKCYRSSIERTRSTKGIRPHFRHAKVAQLTSADVEAFHRLISRTAPITSNRSFAVMSRMLNYRLAPQPRPRAWGRGSNPWACRSGNRCPRANILNRNIERNHCLADALKPCGSCCRQLSCCLPRRRRERGVPAERSGRRFG
jgi:hypothetical protein